MTTDRKRGVVSLGAVGVVGVHERLLFYFSFVIFLFFVYAGFYLLLPFLFFPVCFLFRFLGGSVTSVIGSHAGGRDD